MLQKFLNLLTRITRFLFGGRPREPVQQPLIISRGTLAACIRRRYADGRFYYETENRWIGDEMYADHFERLLSKFTGVDCEIIGAVDDMDDSEGWTKCMTLVSGLSDPIYYEVQFKIIPSKSE